MIVPRYSPTRRAEGEEGFTLVEVLVAVAILGLIMTPLATAFILALRTTGESSNRIATANDSEILTVYFPPDVHGAGSQAGDVAIGGAGGTTCSGLTNVVTLSGRAQESPGATGASDTTWTVAYAVESSGAGSWRLVRARCVNGGSPQTTRVATNLASATAATAATIGRRVTLTVRGVGTTNTPAGTTFEVSATRRAA